MLCSFSNAMPPFSATSALLSCSSKTELQTGLQTGHKTSNWPSDWIQTIQLAFRLGTKHQMAFRGPSDWIQNIQLAFRLDTKHQIGLQTGNKTSNWPADWTTVWTPQCQILKPLCVKSRLEFMRKAINRQSTGNRYRCVPGRIDLFVPSTSLQGVSSNKMRSSTARYNDINSGVSAN